MKFLLQLFIIITIVSCTKFGKNMTVKGRVLNPITGEGIPNVPVIMYRSTLDYPSGSKRVKETTTDSDGYFEISKASLSKCYLTCHTTDVGDYYPIGWEKKDDVPLFDAFTISVKKGKTMHADYYVLPYGEIKISIHNINCQGPNDTLIYKRSYVSLNGISVFQPFTLTGCYDNDGEFAKVPSGNYLVEWTVIRNGISNSYSHIVTVPENGQVTYNIDY
ncbi:carboxypeptidase-like regulatory domain-containing protein [Fluviicola chungangensis]|uniref:Carboxypeptidase regulatory-like domain-containing protein n=1 Tax=Fluviicola chungangensis TaxID=2597671 RepID=A0A556MJF2_9FLAO|nr:carboxypeptidase-like regulatory domain-containing protein [Fluviicola chungangensis]TSJ39999.1 carboxypeptidase regulatory-like domain-containing protein [Fluviicola chungangensis]